MSSHVYAIGKISDLQPPYNNCYIGVAKNTVSRWKNHQKSQYTIGQYIRLHNLTYNTNLVVIFEGIDEECFLIERKYRPISGMGLNEAAGGHGGHTNYTKERNLIISQKIKAARKLKKWVSHKNRSSYDAEKNPNAKAWILIDKSGNIFHINGKLTKFCIDHNLLETCLRYYLNREVPQPNTNGYGGYRVKNEQSRTLRMNTTGWTLIRQESCQEV